MPSPDASRLALRVRHPDGEQRWSFDEVDAGNVPDALSFVESSPGGFKTLTCGLMRDFVPRAEEGLYNSVTAHGPGGEVAWEGRLAELPRDSGDSDVFRPGAVGHAAALDDDESFMQVFVDSDPASFGEPPLERRVAYASESKPLNADYQVTSGNGGGMLFTGPMDQVIVAGSAAEVWYQMPPGVLAATFMYRGQEAETGDMYAAAVYSTATRDGLTNTSVALTLDDTMRTATLDPSRYVYLAAQASATHTRSSGPPHPFGREFRSLAVYGDHGLPLQAITGRPSGVLASDVVDYVVARQAPQFTRSITPTTYPIPHLAFREPTTASEVVGRANAFHDWHWGCREGREFFFEPFGTGPTWQVREADGARLSSAGASAANVANSIVVQYQDNGLTKWAGPPGSGMDVESSELEDTSAANPANVAGVTRRRLEVLSLPTTDAGAVELGALVLAEWNMAAQAGSITVPFEARHPTEGMVPAWRMRSGDLIAVTDRPGFTAQRIIEVAYDHPSRTATVTLNSTPHRVEALMERLLLGANRAPA